MSNGKPATWPLLPAHTAYTLHGICLAMADLVQGQGGNLSRRALLKANALATASELLSGELAHFFSSRMGEDHERLEAIEDRYREERQR